MPSFKFYFIVLLALNLVACETVVPVVVDPPEGGEVDENTEILACGDLDNALTLKNSDAVVDYLIKCDMKIKGKIKVEPGTVIAFGEDASLSVSEGSFNAIGTTSEPIILRGEVQNKGHWKGIAINTNQSDNQLEHVRISDTGSRYISCCDDPTSLYISGRVSLKNVEITDGLGHGIHIHEDAHITAFHQLEITGHNDYPIFTDLEHVHDLDGLGSDYTGNQKDFVYIYNSNADKNITWTATNVPYLMEGETFKIYQAVNIETGVEIALQEDAAWAVKGEGSLNISGTTAKPVRIRGENPNKGLWKGILIETTNSNNQLSNVHISDASGKYVECCHEAASIALLDGQLGLNKITISNGEGYGILAENDATFSAYHQVRIMSHDKEPLYIALNRVHELDGLGSDYTGNVSDFIRLIDNDLDREAAWEKSNVPYLFEQEVYTFTKGVTLKSGVEWVFLDDSGLRVKDEAYLKIEGTASEMIRISGKETLNGYWRGITIETNSDNNYINYAQIENGGGHHVVCCYDPTNIFVENNARLRIENSSINHSAGCGIGVDNNGFLTEMNNTFSNNMAGNICQN